MEENAVNPEQTLKKEKKSLDPRIAFALMVIMIICSLLIGANKAWKKNREGVDTSFAVWQENVQQRVETAYNLLTVAGRYVPADDAQYAGIQSDLNEMKSSADINRQAAAGQRFITDAKQLLQTLSGSAAVQNDARDKMYVELMLPQALEQCGNSAALNAYNTAAESFNSGLRSVSGLLARLTGVARAELIASANAE